MISKSKDHPHRAPSLQYNAKIAEDLFTSRGSNCGPGAIAGVCGMPLETVLDVLGAEFDRRRATTEIMLVKALTSLGVSHKQIDTQFPSYGLARIQWGGPWIVDPDPFEKLRHSHWVGVSRTDSTVKVFDYNAISIGGWVSLEEWATYLQPWLLSTCEPQADGQWWVSDAYEIDLASFDQSNPPVRPATSDGPM